MLKDIRKQKGKALLQMRIDAGITQTHLATLSTLRQATISKMERGLVAWSIDSEILYINAVSKYAHENKL